MPLFLMVVLILINNVLKYRRYGMRELYSIRIKENSGDPEVFIYEFPEAFRNQFIAIYKRYFGDSSVEEIWRIYEQCDYLYDFLADISCNICKMFAEEKGLKSIENNDLESLERYIDSCSCDDFLDLIDFILGEYVENKEIEEDLLENNINILPEYLSASKQAVKDLNHRFKQNAIGFEFIKGEIIKKTNTVTHEKIVKPALKLLHNEEFRSAEDEYLKAFEFYRKNNNEEAISNASKAFESTMKIICKGMGYEYDKDKDTASKLLGILQKNKFYPSYLNNHMNGLQMALSSGATTIRNKDAAHGQGSEIRNVEDNYVEYILNLVASNIVFLCNIYKEKK